MFYTLNPEIRDQDSVNSNYKFKLPLFPKADKEKEKLFNKEFKKEKRNSNPDTFEKNFKSDLASNRTWFYTTVGSHDSKNSFDNYFEYFSDRPEKFVFVIWEKDKDGKPITVGSQVENRFLVYYYSSYVQGDTSRYHKADDATYGYAAMWNVQYKIIILDKTTNKVMKISDDHINPSAFFEKKDILTL